MLARNGMLRKMKNRKKCGKGGLKRKELNIIVLT